MQTNTIEFGQRRYGIWISPTHLLSSTISDHFLCLALGRSDAVWFIQLNWSLIFDLWNKYHLRPSVPAHERVVEFGRRVHRNNHVSLLNNQLSINVSYRTAGLHPPPLLAVLLLVLFCLPLSSLPNWSKKFPSFLHPSSFLPSHSSNNQPLGCRRLSNVDVIPSLWWFEANRWVGKTGMENCGVPEKTWTVNKTTFLSWRTWFIRQLDI